ncbi:O-methyltransferase [Bacillus timonensis]|nr:O-methyltransferase [Bacillus timonensis]
MVSDQLNAYLENLLSSQREQEIIEIELYAKENNVPIMELVGIETLLQLLRMIQPTNILEVGSAIGYSAIRMAKTLPSAKIVTIERDIDRYNLALENIEKTGTTNQIEITLGDALELYDTVKSKGSYDVIFIDAAKGQYQKFFELYEPLLSKNGVIITDNVLFKGLVAEEHIENKRTRSLVKKIKNFNDWLVNQKRFTTTIIPVGDGIAISIKRGESK